MKKHPGQPQSPRVYAGSRGKLYHGCGVRLYIIPFQKGRVLAQDGVHWYNTQRLLEPIGNVSPVEYEMNYYRSQEGSLEMARLN